MLSRRGFVGGSLATLAGAIACRRGPAIRTRLPAVTHGLQVGDAGFLQGRGRGLVWARCDEPARMIVEWDTTDRFASPTRIAGPVVTPASDLTGTVALAGLPLGQTIAYRVRFEREAARGESAWQVGRFAMPAPELGAKFRLAWSGDTCGQGFGRNPEWGGLVGFSAIRAAEPQVFVNSGDLIYADNPIVADHVTVDGRPWKNITNERVARVAESLDDFRARFAYNFEDDHVRNLLGEVSVIAQWDDHETHNNWWPGQQLDDERYRERDASKLAALARRAMFEWTPIGSGDRAAPIHRVVSYGPLLDVVVLDLRSFRTPNDTNLASNTESSRAEAPTGLVLGDAQGAWLVETLAASQARWKVIACDQPISLVIGDGPTRHEGVANGDPGPPRGREHELAMLLGELKRRGVKNCVWITADVHYAAAHHYDPARAQGGIDFEPFWEFVAGPIHAGTFGPEVLDPSLGGEVRFQWAPPPGTGNLPPSDGYQSFGTIDVARDALTVAIWDIAGRERYRVDIPFTS